jgi:methylthioribose-1-phosphate isomerase
MKAMLQTLSWTGQALRLLDQTRLPTETVYVECLDERQVWDSIKRLVVRGAPAIGVAAAFGVYLGVREYSPPELLQFYTRLNEVADHLATSRPTAVNLFWALERMRRVARKAGRDTHRLESRESIEVIKARLLRECEAMVEEDNRVCRAIGKHGLELLRALHAQRRGAGEFPRSAEPRPIEVLTHCNAGGLATVQYGTALAPIYIGHEQGVEFHVWSDETRPLLQGSRITAFELSANDIPVTVICDSMAASVMAQGKIDAVIVGTDRVAANGDVANKIGTLSVAIAARHFGIPFIVAAPTSSIDLSLASGKEIPIEERGPEEISKGLGRQTAPDDVDIYNPAFDVTPADLVTAIVTEKGVARPPYDVALAVMCRDFS